MRVQYRRGWCYKQPRFQLWSSEVIFSLACSKLLNEKSKRKFTVSYVIYFQLSRSYWTSSIISGILGLFELSWTYFEVSQTSSSVIGLLSCHVLITLIVTLIPIVIDQHDSILVDNHQTPFSLLTPSVSHILSLSIELSESVSRYTTTTYTVLLVKIHYVTCE